MANIVQPHDVFEFMGTPSDVRDQDTKRLEDLISRMQSEIEETIDRKVEQTTFTNVLFQDGLNCSIFKDKLFLNGVYRDILTITSITEAGETLTASTAYSDGNDYAIDARRGILLRMDQWWSQEQLAIKISGTCGLVDSNNDPRPDIKQILIEMVAAKSGLWKLNIETEGGTIQQVRTSISKDTMTRLEKFKQRGY